MLESHFSIITVLYARIIFSEEAVCALQVKIKMSLFVLLLLSFSHNLEVEAHDSGKSWSIEIRYERPVLQSVYLSSPFYPNMYDMFVWLRRLLQFACYLLEQVTN